MKRPNIIWFMIDSLRNEFLNEFGAQTQRTFLDDIISKGVSFTKCYSSAPFTIVSVGSKMTGCYPSLNKLDGWLKEDPIKSIDSRCVSIIDILRYNGYYTAYYASSESCTYLDPKSFDLYYAQNGSENFPLENYANQKGPKFIYMSLDHIHDACCFNQNHFYKKDYYNSVKEISTIIEKYYHLIKTNDDLILITSDHGIRTLDDFTGNKYSNELTTGRYLTEKTTQSSFNIIWNNNLFPKKIHTMCRSVDIFPTVMDLLEMEYPRLDGVSLLPMITGENNNVDIKYSYTITGWSNSHPMNAGAWCVRDEKYKLVLYEEKCGFGKKIRKELFNYIDNPEEDVDLMEMMPQKANELYEKAEKYLFSRRNIVDYYDNTHFDYNKYLNCKIHKINEDVIKYANKILEINWKRKVRRSFLFRYYKSEIKRIVYYYLGLRRGKI